jgi:predicted dehydrogenase
MKRFDPGVQYAADAIHRRIGPVVSASVWYRVMSALRPPTEATLFPALIIDEQVRAQELTFKADREAYLLTTHGAHVLDGLRFLLGDPVELSAQLARSGADLSWHGLARLDQGGLAHFEITANVHAEWSEGADIYGELGHVRLRTHFPFSLRASDVEVFVESTSTSERPVFGDSNAYERQLEAFAVAIRDDLPDQPDARDGLIAVRLIAAVARSVSEGGATIRP